MRPVEVVCRHPPPGAHTVALLRLVVQGSRGEEKLAKKKKDGRGQKFCEDIGELCHGWDLNKLNGAIGDLVS